MTEPASEAVRPPRRRENLLLNLALNIALPTVILSKLSTDRWLGPVWGLVAALSAPIGYFVYDYAVRRRANFISMIGMASVAATGSLGLLKVGGLWFAVKEAAVPLVVGFGMVFSTGSRRPLVRDLLFNEELVDAEKVRARLEERGANAEFEKLLRRAGYGLAAGFLVSAVLNFSLVQWVLKAPPGTAAFNAQLGRINLLSWPIVVAPMLVICAFALWQVFRGLRRLTGLAYDDLFRAETGGTAAEETSGASGAIGEKPEAAESAAPGGTSDQRPT